MQKLLKTGSEEGAAARMKGHLFLKFFLAFLASAVAIIWFWSTTAVELFQAPPLRFSDAIAGLLALVGIGYAAGTAFRLGQDHGRD